MWFKWNLIGCFATAVSCLRSRTVSVGKGERVCFSKEKWCPQKDWNFRPLPYQGRQSSIYYGHLYHFPRVQTLVLRRDSRPITSCACLSGVPVYRLTLFSEVHVPTSVISRSTAPASRRSWLANRCRAMCGVNFTLSFFVSGRSHL